MPTLTDRKRSELSRETQDLLIKEVLKYFKEGDFVQYMTRREPFVRCIKSRLYSEMDVRNTRDSLILSGHLAAIGKGRGRKLKTTKRGWTLYNSLRDGLDQA